MRARSRPMRSIAADLGVSPGDVAAMDARLSGVDLSLNAPVTKSGDDGAPTRGDRLVDDAPLPDDIVAERIDSERRRASLRRSALATLNERELRIVAARRLREEAATLETLGARLGISKERVRQIEARALDKLRRFLCDPSQDWASRQAPDNAKRPGVAAGPSRGCRVSGAQAAS